MRDYGVEGQIGLEPDFRDYVKKLVRIFIELKRVLKEDGSFYLNLGDSYSHSGGAGTQYHRLRKRNTSGEPLHYRSHKAEGLPPKCMVGIPWRVALALIRKGWILRNDVIWHKPNALPASVKDRLTNTYEHVFHFVKSKKYYYDLDTIRVPHKSVTVQRLNRFVDNKEHYDPTKHKTDPHGMYQSSMKILEHTAKGGLNPLGKNPGDVSSFETEKLTEKIAREHGYDPNGICETCGRTWKRHASPNAKDRKTGLRRVFLPCIKNVYNGKLSDNSEQYSSPRARRAREEFQDNDYHPKGKNPGDIYAVNLARGIGPTNNRHRLTPVGRSAGYGIKGKNPGDVISQNKQDNVPSRNTNTYKGFNDRWKQREKDRRDALTINSVRELLDAKKQIRQGDIVNYKGRLYRVRRSRAETDYDKTKHYDSKFMPAANMSKLPVMVPLDGKNPGDFWIINTRGFKGAHFAVYPEELLRRPILSSSKIEDVVLDPFIGSGTSAVVAKKFGRRFLGCDINAGYVKIAEERLALNSGH